MQGHTNIPLNHTGRQQARQTLEKLRNLSLTFDCVYSSPLDRALETAEILSMKARSEFVIDNRILELGFGVLEGTSFRVDPAPEVFVLNQDPKNYVPPEGGESLEELFDRTHDFLEELRISGPPGNILIVTHGAAIRSMLQTLIGLDVSDFWSVRIGNCDVLHFQNIDGKVTECEPVVRNGDPFDPHSKAT